MMIIIITVFSIFSSFILNCNGIKVDPTAIDKKIFCLYSNKGYNSSEFKVENINERYCTHLVYTYMGIQNNGKIKSLNPVLDFRKGNINKFNLKKHYNRNLKTLIAVGGHGHSERSQRFSDIFGKEVNQHNFVRSIINFLVKYKFNGLVLNWMYPGLKGGNSKQDKFTYISLLMKLRLEFTRKKFILGVMCHAINRSIEISYDVNKISQNVDYIFLQSYDFYGAWSKHIGIASSLYLHPHETNKDLSVDSAITNWIERGAKPNKIVMGIPFFSRTFTLKYRNQTEPGSSHNGPGMKTQYVKFAGKTNYYELCQKIYSKMDKWVMKWENTQKIGYAYNENDHQWIGFENEKSLQIKSKYILEKNLAGTFVLHVGDDDFKGVCGERYPLLKVLNVNLKVSSNSDEYQLHNDGFFNKLNDNFLKLEALKEFCDNN